MLARPPCLSGVLLAALLVCRVARAEEPAEAPPPVAVSTATTRPTPSIAKTIGLGIAGALTGFFAHEAGHVFANLMLGNSPNFEGTLVWGWLPFFVVAPGIHCDGDVCTDRGHRRFRPGRRGNYFIVTAGFHVQHFTDELLLGQQPSLRHRYAPFQKGILLFNVALSCIYAVGAYTGLEDPHGDLAGAARLSGIHEAWLASTLLLPAMLDVYRYWVPDARWAPWASRSTKSLLFGLNFTF